MKNDEEAQTQDTLPIERSFAVALSHPEDKTRNTVMLGGLDIVIPMERDLDKDPDTPDELRFKSKDGGYETHVTSDGPDTEPDDGTPLLRYRFRDVPPGQYTIAVKVEDDWLNVVAGIRVTRTEVRFGDGSYEDAPEGSKLGTPAPPAVEPDDEEGAVPHPDEEDYCCSG